MAKGKRKPSSAQRSKYFIQVAKQLKEKGILSKRANLHSGNYISPAVLKKAREYDAFARLNYKAYPVSKKQAEAAKERGYTVIAGNKIIGPTETTFRNRIKRGELTGIKPVRGGFMEEVTLPHTVFDIRSLMDQLEKGIDTYKLPGEQFAFKYRGYESYRAFMNTEQLLEYLMHYKGVTDAVNGLERDDEFEAITIFRLHPSDIGRTLPGLKERAERSRRERAGKIARGEIKPRRSNRTYADIIARASPAKLKIIKEKDRVKKQRKREKLTGEALEKYREAARKRAQASYERGKK